MRFASRYLVCHGREIHYTEWGEVRGEPGIAGIVLRQADNTTGSELMAPRHA